MSYEKHTWVNNVDAVDEDKMNHIENGIKDLDDNKVNKSGDTMTGGLNMQGNPIGFGSGGNIYFKEDGFGDKFRILPNFNGSGSDNRLILQSTIGDAGEDPQNWKDLVYIHADSGEINLIDILTCNRIQTNRIDLNNGAFAPRCFQLGWGKTLIANTEVGGHGLIMVSQDVLYMFWISGGNHDQLSVKTIWGDSNYCQVTMTDNAHLEVTTTTTNGNDMTCSILFIRGN